DRQADTTYLESGPSHVFMTWWHRTQFDTPYCVRTAFTGD
ncbi:hypothetical protein PSYPI_47758, partial [Pseudomonas syringae pv. pisi str. 1704B]